MHAVAITIPTADVVVVIEDEEGLAAIDIMLGLVNAAAEERSIHLVEEAHLHVHGQLQFVVVRAVPLA